MDMTLRVGGSEFETFKDGSARITLASPIGADRLTIAFEAAEVREIVRHLSLVVAHV